MAGLLILVITSCIVRRRFKSVKYCVWTCGPVDRGGEGFPHVKACRFAVGVEVRGWVRKGQPGRNHRALGRGGRAATRAYGTTSG